MHREILRAKGVSSAQRAHISSVIKYTERDNGTYWKAVIIPSSSSSSHCSIPSAQPDGRTSGESGITVPIHPPPPKKMSSERRRRGSSSTLLAPSLKSKSLNLFEKKVPNPIFYVCVCRFVCLSVFLLFFLPPHHQVLAWCQMFQLSIAVQHHWWWT